MPKLRDYFFSDLSSLFNTDEFSESVIIDGVLQNIVIDEDRLKKRTEKEYAGVSSGMILYFIPVSSFAKRPSVGDSQIFNNKLMHIMDVNENEGLYEIILTQNRGE